MEIEDWMLKEIREELKVKLITNIEREHKSLFLLVKETVTIALVFVETNGRLLLSDFLNDWEKLITAIQFNHQVGLTKDDRINYMSALRQIRLHQLEFNVLVESVLHED